MIGRKPWISRAIDGPGLHALIIGTSDYQYLPAQGQVAARGCVTFGLKKLDIAATGAFRFAEWLIGERYWHPSVKVQSIRLLLAPSTAELDLVPGLKEVAAQVPRTDTQTVWEELQAWQQDCLNDREGIAVLYAAGHGIQWGSTDDALILLEDFSKDQLFLNQTLDVGTTLKAMNGENMPQTQFYFADACAVEPDQYADYVDAGKGLSLAVKKGGSELRTAPLYFAACPGTTAKGKPGTGTYFAQALIECLNGEEPYWPPLADSESETDKYYRVTVSSLVDNLKNRVKKIDKKQEVVAGGKLRPGVFSAVKENLVTVEVHVDPELTAKATEAELLTWEELPKIDLRPCFPVPAVLGQVEAGSYFVRLLTGANKKVVRRAITAVPPRWSTPIKLQ